MIASRVVASEQHFPRIDAAPRSPALDGIRGVAILMVVIYHYGVMRVPFWGVWLGHTWSGVQLFFVLSGFLLGGILLDHRDATNYFRVFYTRRLCRIFPLYFLWLLIFGVFVLGAFPVAAALKPLFEQPLPWWSYATFTQNFTMIPRGDFGPQWLAITWSLSVEEQFYFVLPLVIRVIPRRVLPYALLAGAISAPLLRRQLYQWLPAPRAAFAGYVLMPGHADALFLGVLCAYLVRRQGSAQRVLGNVAVRYSILGLLLFAPQILRRGFSIVTIDLHLWFAVLYSWLVLIAATEQRGLVSSIMRASLLRRLGILAFGIYLFHQTVVAVLGYLVYHGQPIESRTELLLILGGAFVLTVLLAQISWTFFERPFVTLGHALRYKRLPVTALAVPAEPLDDGVIGMSHAK